MTVKLLTDMHGELQGESVGTILKHAYGSQAIVMPDPSGNCEGLIVVLLDRILTKYETA